MSRHSYWWTVVGILICGCVAHPAPSEEATICGLAGSVARTAGQSVRLRAIYVADLKHGALLKDRQCKSVSVTVIDADGQPVDSSVKKFDEAVWGEVDDLRLRIFRVDVSGVFVAQRSDASLGTFTIQRVWDYKRLQGDDWKTAK